MSALKREILYRGKQKGSGDWVEGVPVQHSDGDWQIQGGYSDAGWRVTVIPETVCQYTGLTDKNGRKIFEGDILRFVNHINNNEWLCSIEFLEGSFICRYIYEDGELGEYNHFTSWHEKVKWEVIGNIFDNPELLEGPI